ncbi:hypothetical protein ISCGN_002984 [Ixodes scapularis]
MRARHARGEAKALYVRTSRHSAIETKNASQGGRRFRRSVSSRIEGTPDPARCHAAGSCQKGAFDEEGLCVFGSRGGFSGGGTLEALQTRRPGVDETPDPRPPLRPLGSSGTASWKSASGQQGRQRVTRRARKDQDGDRDLRVALWILGSFGAPDAAEAMAASGRRRSRETRSSTHDRRKRSGNSRDRRKHRSPSREHSGSKSHRRSRSRLQEGVGDSPPSRSSQEELRWSGGDTRPWSSTDSDSSERRRHLLQGARLAVPSGPDPQGEPLAGAPKAYSLLTKGGLAAPPVTKASSFGGVSLLHRDSSLTEARNAALRVAKAVGRFAPAPPLAIASAAFIIMLRGDPLVLSREACSVAHFVDSGDGDQRR